MAATTKEVRKFGESSFENRNKTKNRYNSSPCEIAFCFFSVTISCTEHSQFTDNKVLLLFHFLKGINGLLNIPVRSPTDNFTDQCCHFELGFEHDQFFDTQPRKFGPLPRRNVFMTK